MIDFDKSFEEYAVKWFDAHKDDFATPDYMEAELPELYERWADEPEERLGGRSPRGYFEDISDPDELVGMLRDSKEPCSLLTDRLARAEGVDKGLLGIINSDCECQIRMTAMNLLNERGVYPFDVYAGWLRDGNVDSDVRELAVEIMADNAALAADLLFPLLDGADTELKTLIAEILVNAPKDERTYRLLTDLFLNGGNIPLYAGYIGKYGDERAAAMLYRALDDCNYLEYLEIKNAIERMGGVVDDDRDFSDDMYYKAIKNLK